MPQALTEGLHSGRQIAAPTGYFIDLLNCILYGPMPTSARFYPLDRTGVPVPTCGIKRADTIRPYGQPVTITLP